jgi:hypothetical protein
MSEPFCEPFDVCDGLDGRLLINAALEGPPLAWDLGEVSFGSFTSGGIAARPYVDVQLGQTWTAKEICYGPIRSIFSLAPVETVEIDVVVRRQQSLTQMVSSATSQSHSLQGPEVPLRDAPKDKELETAMKDAQLQQAVATQASRKASGYGSFLETIANIFAPGVGGAIVDAAEGVAKHVQETSTGGADAIHDAVGQAARAVETISRTASQQLHNESTSSMSSTEMLQSVKRTFSNPYRDRSLQLRFIPVFRHFEVVTRPVSIRPGISLEVGALRTANPLRVRDALAGATAQTDAAVLQRPLASMLSVSQGAGRATKGAAGGAGRAAPSAAGALLWSQSTLREDSVLVPLAAPETAASAFGLKGRARDSFLQTLGRISDEAIARRFAGTTQQLHLFIGTHIEAVAGECVLEDVPPAVAVDEDA